MLPHCCSHCSDLRKMPGEDTCLHSVAVVVVVAETLAGLGLDCRGW